MQVNILNEIIKKINTFFSLKRWKPCNKSINILILNCENLNLPVFLDVLQEYLQVILLKFSL